MQKTSRLHRLLAVVVAVFMAVCCLPLGAFAADGDPTTATFYFIENGNEIAKNTVNCTSGELYETEDLQRALDAVLTGYQIADVNQKCYIGDSDNDWDVKVVRVETPAVEKKIIVNFNNGEGTWTDSVADADPKTFVLSSNTPDAAYSVPADVKAPDGKELVNWTNNWDSSVLNAGDTFSYNSIAAIVGTAEDELYIAYTAQYQDIPAPVEKKITVNFNNGDGTWTDGVADGDPKTFVLSSTTPDAEYNVPADIQAPDGKELVNWTNNWDKSVLNAGDTFSYNSIAAIVGTAEDELYIAYTAQYADKPVQQKLNQINVQFMTNDGKELAVGYTLKAGDKNFIYDAVYDGMVPAGQVLDRWVYASTDFVKGSEISFDSLAKMIGSNYDEKGTAWVTFNPVFVDVPDEGLKTIDVVFVTADGKEVAGHYTLQAGQSNFVYDSVYEGACPEGKILDHWYLNGDQSKVYAPGAAVTFEQLAGVIGDNYDDMGVAYISFSPVFVGTKTVGLNFFDEDNYEQVCETYVELPEDAIHLNTSKIELPDGYEFTSVGDLAIRDGWIYVGVKCVKTLRIYWAIDNENGTFANGQPSAWTQELTWKHVNDDLELPVVNTKYGYVMNGWAVSGQQGEYWKPTLKTMNVGDKYVADEKGGIISITANVVVATPMGGKDDNKTTTTTTVTSTNASDDTQAVKSETPADTSVKILPQTGLTVETPVVFGVMISAALAAAAAYLFAIRKKLN